MVRTTKKRTAERPAENLGLINPGSSPTQPTWPGVYVHSQRESPQERPQSSLRVLQSNIRLTFYKMHLILLECGTWSTPTSSKSGGPVSV